MIFKKILPVLLLLSLLLGVHTTATAQFEGVIYYEIPGMDSQEMDELPYMIKDSNVRMEFGEGNEKGAMLFMPEESKMIILMDAMEGYMSMDLDEAYDNQDFDDTDFTRTDETKTIAGYSCEVWHIETEENIIEACMAKDLGAFMMPKNPVAERNMPDWAKEIVAEGAMPLEVIERNGDTETLQMRATKIEEKSLASTLFEIPSGYSDMSGMMNQMMKQQQ